MLDCSIVETLRLRVEDCRKEEPTLNEPPRTPREPEIKASSH